MCIYEISNTLNLVIQMKDSLSIVLGCTELPLPRFAELDLLAGGRPFRFFVGGGSSLSKRLCRFPRCDIFARSLFTTHFKFFLFSANKCNKLAITLLELFVLFLFFFLIISSFRLFEFAFSDLLANHFTPLTLQ